MSAWSNWRVKPSSGIRRFDCSIYHLESFKRFSVYHLEIVGALDFELRGSGSGLGPGHCALFVGLQCLSPLRSINEFTGELSGNCNFRRFHRSNSCPARPKLCSTAPACARFYRHFLCLRQDYSHRDFLGDLSLSEPSVRESELFTFNIKRYITFILLGRLDSSSNSPPLKARTTVKCQWAGQWG